MMIKLTFLWFAFTVLSNFGVDGVQPYFPPQLTFTMYDNRVLYAIDELNQRAYQSSVVSPTLTEYSFAMKKFPFAIPGSPESKSYVQLKLESPSNNCSYGTYWQYGGNVFNSFPSHWNFNASSFKIQNFIDFQYNMIRSSADAADEDYWYANETCEIYTGEKFPCQEIYFKKNTDIPLRTTAIVRQGWDLFQEITPYNVLSIGKPDEKFFDQIPTNWAYNCTDLMLYPVYNPTILTVELHKKATVEVSLFSPPHRIDGSDTVTIGWRHSSWSNCSDCLTWTPKQFSFNSDNFQQTQKLTFTRIKNGGGIYIIPIFNGGGFDVVPADNHWLAIE